MPQPLSVLSAAAMTPIMSELAHAFEQSGGTRVSLDFTRSRMVRDRVRDGEKVDVVITTQAAIDDLARAGELVLDSVAAVARSGIGVAVRAGSAKPDIASAAAFTRMLREAGSIAYADPATGSPSGNYLASLFRRLGLADELAPKTRLIGPTGHHSVVVCEAVARGEAEIGMQQVCEILPVKGVELVGPLPGELQHVTVFAAAVAARARDVAVARRFVAFIASEAASPAIAAAGMERG